LQQQHLHQQYVAGGRVELCADHGVGECGIECSIEGHQPGGRLGRRIVNASASDAARVGAAPSTNPTVMDIRHTYTAGQNNGRIAQAKDRVLGQTSNYTYDALNRLSTVSIIETGMGEQMSYDGFGNVTGMNGAAVWTHDPATNRMNAAG